MTGEYRSGIQTSMSKKKTEKSKTVLVGTKAVKFARPANPERLTVQTCVRFTPEQWAKVMKLAGMRKVMVAELLRACVLEEYSRNRPR